jgi:hypothetical protein
LTKGLFVAQKFSTASFVLLILIGPILALAIKGFSALLALGKWLPRKQSENEIWRTGAWAAAMGTLMFSYNFWQAWLVAGLLICALCATILLPDDAAE